MKLRTRIMALILAVVLCISMTATGVYAEEAAANILETTVELVEDHACEEHDETAAELETVPAENAAEADAEADIEDAKPQADTADATDAEVEVEAAAPSDESMESAPVEEVDVAEVQDEALVEDTTATSDEEAVDEVVVGAEEVLAEEFTLQSYAETLNSDGVTLTEKPEIDYGKTGNDNEIAVLVEVEEYYSMAFEALALINEERAAYNLDPVVMDEVLLEAAFQRAAETVVAWDHGRPNGTDCTSICSIIRSENIGHSCLTAEEMIAGWMSSAGHRANIIHTEDIAMGIACIKVDGIWFWVLECSEELYREVNASGYTDKMSCRTVYASKSGSGSRTSITVEDENISLEENTALNVTLTTNFTHFIIPLPAEGFTLTSTDESVCTVSADGTITGVGEGSASIIAYYPGYEEGAWEIPITVCVHEYTSEVTTEPTCSSWGEDTYTCSKCGDVYTTTTPILEHIFDDGVITTPVSCMTSGVKTFTCTLCGNSYTEFIDPPYTHSYDDGTITTAPTCQTKGVRTYTCTVCGTTKTRNVSASTAYCAYDEGVVTKEPSCTKVGIKTLTCTLCGNTKTSTVSKLGHAYDAGTITTEPSCTADGVKTFTCQRCGATTTEAVASTGEHNYEYSVEVITAATCTSGGQAKKSCACGVYVVEDIPVLGHDIVTRATEAATCTEAGHKAYETCSRCDYTTYEEVAAVGHSYDEGVVTTAATCAEAGVKTFTCVSCQDAYTESIPATGHTYDGGKTTKTATCTEAGVEAYTCTTCGNSYTVVLPMASHKEEKDAAAPAGCESTGLTEGSHCSVCGTVLVAQEEIPVTGHSYTSVVTTKPTCTEAGVKTFTCASCQDSYTEAVDALGHDIVEHDAKAATCTEAGHNAYETCSRCDYTTYETVEATGHAIVSGTAVEPSCEVSGLTAGSLALSVKLSWRRRKRSL